MKKLLATLLVAAMLISCMSVIAFADGENFYADSSFAGSISFIDHTSKLKYNDTVAKEYYDYLNAIYDDGDGEEVPDTLFMAMWNAKDEKDEELLPGAASFPYKFTKDEIVVMPIHIVDVMSFNIELSASATLEYLGYTGGDGFSLSYGVSLGGMASANTTADLYIWYKVKSDATSSNATTDDTATISFTPIEIKQKGNVDATVGNSSTTINLTGLTPGAAEEKEDITADKMPVAEVPAFTADADVDKEWLTKNAANIVPGDGNDVDLEGS